MQGSARDGEDVLQALAEVVRADPPSGDALGALCEHLGELVQAQGVMVAALDEGQQPWLLGGPEGELRALGAAQFDLGEGPCVDASQSGMPVWAHCGSSTSRWPSWAPRAVEAGVDSVVSVPVPAEGAGRSALGTVWMAFDQAWWFEDGLLRAASTAASIALWHLSWARELEQRRQQVGQLEHALQSRILIEQAKGFVAARDGISPGEAFERLRRTARSSQRRLLEVAAETLRDGTAGLPSTEAGALRREAGTGRREPLDAPSGASGRRPPRARP